MTSRIPAISSQGMVEYCSLKFFGCFANDGNAAQNCILFFDVGCQVIKITAFNIAKNEFDGFYNLD